MTQIDLALQAGKEQRFGQAIFYGRTSIAHARKMQKTAPNLTETGNPGTSSTAQKAW
ncbi:hypothetical protein [Xanthomonas albilineans]|uniref:hypothetical protein n=1 Tax=Xanthomonas albilineans TaxID=29447 RepID=UPI0018B0922A|nr:hypothetical protein [Xanthomonas albilineans]